MEEKVKELEAKHEDYQDRIATLETEKDSLNDQIKDLKDAVQEEKKKTEEEIEKNK